MESFKLQPFFEILYPTETPNRVRDRPMKVLAVGLSRTGTDSLRQALQALGYDHVYHGFDCIASAGECKAWCQLYVIQASGKTLTAEDFDKILGESEAITDHPASHLAPALIDAYPDAKVIINRRKDMDAWYKSFTSIPMVMDGFLERARVWVDAEKFWTARFVWSGAFQYFRRDFARNAIPVYLEHYQRIEDKLKDRKYLTWYVEDGWEPLCKYLEKPVPTEPFPNGNTPPEFYAKVGQSWAERDRRANRNLLVVGIMTLAGCVFAVGAAWRRR